MACHSHGARKRRPIHAAGTYGILQTPGGQGAFLRLDWNSGFLFSWEVTKTQEVLAMFGLESMSYKFWSPSFQYLVRLNNLKQMAQFTYALTFPPNILLWLKQAITSDTLGLQSEEERIREDT
jgi:hypothetical protein